MAADRVRISKRTVDAAVRPEEGESRLWDDADPGFCLRLYSNGRKVYAVKYRVGSRQRWFTIGDHGAAWKTHSGEVVTLTADIARSAAREVLADARRGIDHQAAKLERRKAITVAELIDLYLADGPATRPAKRPSSWATDKSNLDNHLRPQLGGRPARSVTRTDIALAMKGVREGTTAKDVKTKPRGRAIVRGGDASAARVKAAASAMFSWAIERGLVSNNPTFGVKLPRRPAKERFLSDAEAATLLGTLSELSDGGLIPEAHADALRLLLLTGARKSEIVAMSWEEVDCGRTRLVLPPERSKAGGKLGERRILLNPTAMKILVDRRPDDAAGLVFPAARGKGPITNLQKTWATVRTKAKLGDVRIHDLRHSFASFAIADGASLPLIAKALGHSSTRVTERYAHLTDDPVQALANRAGRRIMREEEDPDSNGDQSKPSADVVELKKVRTDA